MSHNKDMSCLPVFTEKVPVKFNLCSRRWHFIMGYSPDIRSRGWWLWGHFHQAVDDQPFFGNRPTNWRE